MQQQLQRTERLIRIADPDGWYKPTAGGSGSSGAAAAAAKAAAKQALDAERQRRAAAVAAQRAGWAAAQVSLHHLRLAKAVPGNSGTQEETSL